MEERYSLLDRMACLEVRILHTQPHVDMHIHKQITLHTHIHAYNQTLIHTHTYTHSLTHTQFLEEGYSIEEEELKRQNDALNKEVSKMQQANLSSSVQNPPSR